jgi:C1A family cysteine protease
VFVGVLLLASAAIDYEKEFLDFTSTYQKVYPNDGEAAKRFAIFKANLDMIEKHNSEGHSWTMGVNEYADMTWEEFKATHLGLADHLETIEQGYEVNLAGLFNVPSSIDWESRGAVTPVKNQGQCGSCWSFSVTGAIEGANAVRNGRLVSLSEQQLVDCNLQNGGCNGGWMNTAFSYVIQNGGLCSESDYPYLAYRQSCRSSSCRKASTISSYKNVAKYSESALQAATAMQPVAIALDAGGNFMMYRSGVMDGQCGTSLNHAVLITGYGTDGGKDYWKVKNSWGTSWGENGYIRLARNFNYPYGQCGVTMAASYPIA